MRPDEKLQAALMVIVLAYGVLTVAPVILGDRIVEPFTELGILGPEMKLGDYPREAVVGETVDLYLYLGNHEGVVSYYRVDVKQGDQSMNVSDTQPYGGELIMRYEEVLNDESNSTSPIQVPITESGLNRRIVFELYRYDSAEGFQYYGHWLQLWVNVTEPR